MDTNTDSERIYVAYSGVSPDDIMQITNNSDEAGRLEEAGCNVITATPTTASSLIFLTPNLYDRMDYSTWGAIAKGLGDLHDNHIAYLSGEKPQPFFDTTPFDLPADLAKKRLACLSDFPDPSNMIAQRELTEIVMANEYGRAVNPHQFTNKSLKTQLWNSHKNTKPKTLAAQIESTQTELKAIRDKREIVERKDGKAMLGDLRTEAQLAHQEKEQKHRLAKVEEGHDQSDPMGAAMAAENTTANQLTMSAHIICDRNGEPERITLNDTDAAMAHSEGLTVTTNADIQEIIDVVADNGPVPPSEYMDDTTWQTLAPAIKQDIDRMEAELTYKRTPATIGAIPLDLPQPMVEAYANALQSMYDPNVDLRAHVELAELHQSRSYGREPNLELFCDDSREASWDNAFSDIPISDLDEVLELEYERNSEILSQNNSERAAFGDSAPGSYRAEVLNKLCERELEYAISMHPDAEEDHSPSL